VFLLKNRPAPELIEANSHARLSQSKQLLKNMATPKKTLNNWL